MNRLMKLTLLAAAPCVLSSAATAQTQSSLNETAAQQFRTADRALNTQYTATMTSLSAPTRLLLRDAQRTWITFRDQQCRYEASGVRGGSVFPMIQSQCLARMTTERTRDLRRLSQCEEGDLSCPR